MDHLQSPMHHNGHNSMSPPGMGMGTGLSASPLDSMDPGGRLNYYLQVDTERQNFIQSMVEKIKRDSKRISELELDLDDQKRSRSRYQQQAAELERGIQRYEQQLDSDAFIVVLIDGDGAKFRDDLIRDIKGGETAAQDLKRSVRDYLATLGLRYQHVPILVRVYANLEDLSRALRLSNVVDHEQHMRQFAEKFTNSSADIDFVNVGRGKENADSKIRRMLSHYHKNLQCKKIFLAGCCHDNGYLHDLREYRGVVEDKLVLLETTPAEPGFHSLGYPITRFDSVFRSDPLNNENKRPPHNETIRRLFQAPVAVAMNVAQHNTTNQETAPPPSMKRPETTSPIAQAAKPASAPAVQAPTNSNSSKASSPISKSTGTAKSATQAGSSAPPVKPPARTASVISSGKGGTSISYANVGDATEYENVTITTAKPKKEPKMIFTNAAGYRIDPPATLPPPKNSTAQINYQSKIAKIKPSVFCNEHYLRGRCSWGNKCDKTHNVELTPSELAIHRFKARTSLCPSGPHCDDYDCYLSHHCIRNPCTREVCCFDSDRYGDLHFSKQDLEPAIVWTEGSDVPENIT